MTGPAVLGKKIIAMPWTNVGGAPAGYIKLVTPIAHNESNMFQIHIVGYRYFGGDTFDIRCSGYAYTASTLINTSCETGGTDLPVEIGTETRPGGTDPLVVVRIGTPASTWYYAHFSAEYDGWVAKSPSDFQWVFGETTPAQTGNLNNIIADDRTGKLTVGAAGTHPTANRLTVNGASAFNGYIGIGTTAPNQLLHINTADTAYAAIRINTATNQGGSLAFMGLGYTQQPGSAHQAGAFAVQGGESGGLSLLASSPTGNVRLYTAGSGPANERVRITQTGNVGIGTTAPATKLHVVGNSTFTGDATFTGTVTGGNIQAKYQDVAEWVPATSDMEPGTVVVLNEERTNEVMPSHRAYDTSVAGVVSAQPGVLLGVAGDAKEQIATTGRVRVRVDARSGAIRVGDLLVTSDVPGTAMKSTPIDLGGVPIHRPGTIIGKALEPLDSGVGEILVLLSLQ